MPIAPLIIQQWVYVHPTNNLTLAIITMTLGITTALITIYLLTRK